MVLDWLLDSQVEFFAGDPVADYGTASVIDWSSPRLVATVPASVQPVPAEEQLLDRNAIITRWQAWIPVTAGLSELMRVRHRGEVYDIDGSIQHWSDPAGVGLEHLTFFMRRADG